MFQHEESDEDDYEGYCEYIRPSNQTKVDYNSHSISTA